MNYIGIVTVRTKSSRLPGKCLSAISKDTLVIEHVILRCLQGGINPIICTTLNKEDKILVKIAQKFGIKFFRGSEMNKIKRWYDCVVENDISFFHTVDADDLYFDPEAIKKSINLLIKNNLDIVHPSVASRNGAASEGYSFSKKGIEKLYLSTKTYKFKSLNTFDTEMIDSFLNNANLKSRIFKGQSYELKKNIRFTLDYPEDLKMFRVAFKKFGPYGKRIVINKYLKKNKNILKINFFRNKEWKNRQDEKIKI
jgi:spore coat polysaccharide biosynthesis protein SpsF